MLYGAYSMKNAFCIQNLSHLIAYSQVQAVKPSFSMSNCMIPGFLSWVGPGNKASCTNNDTFFQTDSNFPIGAQPCRMQQEKSLRTPSDSCTCGRVRTQDKPTTHQFDEYLELTTSLKLCLLQHEQRDGYIQVSTFTS